MGVFTTGETRQKLAKQFIEQERNEDCKYWAGLEHFPGISLLIQYLGDGRENF